MSERVIDINTFSLRPYQLPIYNAIEKDGYKRIMMVWPRRSGKDFMCWVLAIRQALKKTCLVMYALPTFSQARRAVFDAITNDGRKFIDLIPRELIKRINHQEMKITLINDSLIQLIGGDSFDTSLVGTNPYAIILSEFSLMDPRALDFARPILAANGGWLLIQGTPRGKNAFYDLYNRALKLPDWKVIKYTTSQIKHIPQEILDQERAQMSEALYLQEYETSFDRGIEGSYYGRYIDQLKNNGQIGAVAWDPSLLVHTAWDIGVNDATTIIFYQQPDSGTQVRIIDFYSNNGVGLDHYAKFLQDKPYRYGTHFGPHDLRVREWGSGAVSRYEKARQLGIEFQILPQHLVSDGIENCMTHFNKLWIDETKCRSLINCLENYHREWDDIKQVYSNKPTHDQYSHGADAFRYLCQSLPYTQKGKSGADYDRIRNQSLYGNRDPFAGHFSQGPRFF